MNTPRSLWKRRTGLFLGGVRHRRRRGLRPGQFADDRRGGVAGRRVDGGSGVLALVDVGDDLPTRRQDQRVDPHHVALVAARLDADDLALLDGGLDHLVPGEVGRGGVDAGGLRPPTCGTTAAGCWPRTARRQLVVPVNRLQRGVEHALGELRLRRPCRRREGSRRWRTRPRTAGSRLIRSIELSCAARRRTSCSRCCEASLGSVWMLTLYGPPGGAHVSARRAWPPLSGLMYQVRVGTPEPEPHPAAATSSASSAPEISAALPRRIGCRCPADHPRVFFILALLEPMSRSLGDMARLAHGRGNAPDTPSCAIPGPARPSPRRQWYGRPATLARRSAAARRLVLISSRDLRPPAMSVGNRPPVPSAPSGVSWPMEAFLLTACIEPGDPGHLHERAHHPSRVIGAIPRGSQRPRARCTSGFR